MTKIKICGLFREQDIEYVNEAQPDYAGFILHYPKSHRNVDPETAARLRRGLLPGIKAVGVFVDQPAETILEAVWHADLDIIQLHGHESDAFIDAIREMTDLPVWKAFRITDADDLLRALASKADEVLLDNGYGTGTSFDWRLAGGFGRGYILAGGLTPGNIPEAVHLLQPKVIDISSGVETERVKDREKILAAVAVAHGTKD